MYKFTKFSWFFHRKKKKNLLFPQILLSFLACRRSLFIDVLKGLFHFIHKAFFLLRLLCSFAVGCFFFCCRAVSAGFVEGAEGFFCFLIQFRRSLDYEVLRSDHRAHCCCEGTEHLFLQTDLRIGLGSRFYSVENVSVNGADLHIAAECCLGKRNRCSGENVHILSLEDRMTGYLNLDKQISSRSAVYTRLTFFTDPDALSIVDSGRNVDLNAFFCWMYSPCRGMRYIYRE